MVQKDNKLYQISLLVYDADVNMREILKEYLSMKNFEVACAVDLSDIAQRITKSHFDMLILEIDSFNKSGMKTLDYIKHQNKNLPVLCLGTTSDKQTIIEAFDRGCDDFMTKPISLEVLVCHIKAIMRRMHPQKEQNKVLKANGIVYDNAAQTFNGHHINAKMGQIFELLYNNQNEIVTKKQILAKIWMKDDFYVTRSLSIYILHLRKLLIPYNYKIIAFSKIGYKLVYIGDATKDNKS